MAQAKTTTTLPSISQKKVKLKSDGQLPSKIKKNHQLIFSRQDLSIHELNLFNLMVAHMTPDQWEKGVPVFEFPAAHLSDWLNIESKHLSATLTPVAERLAKKTIGIINSDTDEFDFTPLFKRISYKNAKLTMIPNDELKTEYIDYSDGYGLINSKSFFRLSQSYTKRLYEMLSRFKELGFMNRTFRLDDLRGFLGILDERGKIRPDKKSLSRPSVFLKRCIIDPLNTLAEQCKDEILLLTDEEGNKGFIPIKKGRSIISLKFNYRWINQQVDFDKKAAKETVKDLENKRLMQGIRLTDIELELLATAYVKLDHTQAAEDIYESLGKRNNPESQIEEEEEDNDIEKFMERIQHMKKTNPENEY